MIPIPARANGYGIHLHQNVKSLRFSVSDEQRTDISIFNLIHHWLPIAANRFGTNTYYPASGVVEKRNV